MRKSLAVTAAAALAAGGILAAAGPAVAANANVYILHGIPGVTVDVYVNGSKLLDDFTPGTLTPAQSLPAGTYSVAITAADAPDASAPIIGPAQIPVENDKSYTIVAYLGTDGNPTAKPFENDISQVAAGQGRVTVRHVANAPAVTVTADGAPLAPNLPNGSEAKADVPAKTYAVAVAPASGGAAVFSTELPVAEGANTIVYAYGDLAGGTFAAKVQTITGLHSSPGSVNTGTGGQAGDQGGLPLAAYGVMALATLGLALSARRLAAPRA